MNRRELDERLERIESLLHRLDAAVVVREPGNARSAEAFDGLRKLMIQSGSSQRSHVAHLLSLSDSLDRDAPIELIRDRVSDFLRELGVEKSHDVSKIEWFEITDGEGPGIECLSPAVIQTLSDQSTFIVRKGTGRRFEPSLPSPDDHLSQVEDHEAPVEVATNAGRDRPPVTGQAAVLIGSLGVALGLLISQLF